MLANLPIHAFDRDDLDPPRWPTIGIKLSKYQKDLPPTTSVGSSVEIALHCMHTMMNEWDSYAVDETTVARTIFVDHADVTTTEFDITTDKKNELFLNGVKAATQFVIVMSKTGVPRTSDEARRLAIHRAPPWLDVAGSRRVTIDVLRRSRTAAFGVTSWHSFESVAAPRALSRRLEVGSPPLTNPAIDSS
jgi:hypothetical protein